MMPYESPPSRIPRDVENLQNRVVLWFFYYNLKHVALIVQMYKTKIIDIYILHKKNIYTIPHKSIISQYIFIFHIKHSKLFISL